MAYPCGPRALDGALRDITIYSWLVDNVAQDMRDDRVRNGAKETTRPIATSPKSLFRAALSVKFPHACAFAFSTRRLPQ
jgi:hypothetical protein